MRRRDEGHTDRSTGGTGVLEYADVDAPVPAPDQVVVRTKAISVNYADVVMRRGLYPVMPPLPATLGLEAAGVVDRVGDDVTGVTTGQRVAFIAPNSYAELVAVDSAALIPLPDEISFDVGAAFPIVYLTAHHLLHTIGRIREGGWVLLHAAAGGVGTAVIQLARIAGVNVIGLTSSEQKAERVRELGLEHVFTYDSPTLVQDVLAASGGRGVDLVLDSVAGPDLGRGFDMLAPLGQVLWFGFAGGMPADTLLESLGRHFLRGVGLRTFHLTFSVMEPYPDVSRQAIQTILTRLRDKTIEPVVGSRFPLADAARAHEVLEVRETVGKVLLYP